MSLRHAQVALTGGALGIVVTVTVGLPLALAVQLRRRTIRAIGMHAAGRPLAQRAARANGDRSCLPHLGLASLGQAA